MSDDASANFRLNFQGNAPEMARTSVDALEQLREQIVGSQNELKGMQAAFRNLKGGGAQFAESAKKLQDRITAQKSALAAATQNFTALGGSMVHLRPPAEQAGNALRELLRGVQGGPGLLGNFGSRLATLKGYLGSGLLAGGAVALAAGIVAIGVAAAKSAKDLVTFGLAAADARRNELLLLEGMTKIRPMWGSFASFFRLPADSATFLQGAIDGVSSSVALGRGEINGFAQELYRAGMRGGNLQASLEGMAITAATQGPAQAALFKQMALGFAYSGRSVRALADDVKARLGGIAKAQMLSLGVQTMKLRENFSLLFGDVGIEKFLVPLSHITELLSTSTSSGAALKRVLEGVFGPLGSVAEAVGPVVKNFFRGMVIAALLTTITVLKVRNALRDTFGVKGLFSGWNWGKGAIYAGLTVFGLVMGALTVFGASIATIGGLLFGFGKLVVWTFREVVQAAKGAWEFFGSLFSAVTGGAAAADSALSTFVFGGLRSLALGAKDVWGAVVGVWKNLASFDWGGAGRAMIDGLVSGLRAGIGRVFEAVRDIGSGSLKAFKDVLGIKSPSRKYFQATGEIDNAIVGSLKRGKPRVEAAARDIAPLPELRLDSLNRTPSVAPSTAGLQQRGGGGSVSVTIENIDASGQKDLAGLEAAIRAGVAKALQGIALQMGARP